MSRAPRHGRPVDAVAVKAGFALAPASAFAERCAPVLAAADYFEVLPEGLVDPRDAPGFAPNGQFRRALDLQQRLGVDVVAHGTGLSVCGGHPLDEARLDRWLARAAALAERLSLRWYTEHAGISAPAGLNLTLPVDLPHGRGARDAGRRRLARLASAVGAPVGVENTAHYAPMSDPADEPRWLRSLVGDDHVWLLDVHNLWTHVVNFGVDVDRWLREAPLHRVIELHVSGGTDADPRWTGGVPWRLDSHDRAVPEPVWELLARVLPRCPAARGVTLERLEGTVEPDDVPVLLRELERVRAIAAAAVRAEVRADDPADDRADEPADAPDPAADAPDPAADAAVAARLELRLADAWTARDPLAALRALADDPDEPAWVRAAVGWAARRPDGVGITRRLIARQRFERLVQGSGVADAWFEADPVAFARAFADYAAAVPPAAFLPADEAALFTRWCARAGVRPPRACQP